MAERKLISFPRSPVLHIDGGYGVGICGRTGVDASLRGYLRDHTPFDKPICKRCQAALNPSFEDLAREGGIADG